MPNFPRIAKIVLLILTIPLLGTLFVDGWDWGLTDFIGAGAVLFLVGLAVDLAARKIASPVARAAVIGGIALIFLAAWATVVGDGEPPAWTRLFYPEAA